MRKPLMFLGLVIFIFAGQCHSQIVSTNLHHYKTGYTVIIRLGSDLQKALKPKNREMIHPLPVFLETDLTPFVKPVEYAGNPPMRGVFISAGFINLANQICHAKAIDHIEKGFFDKYLISLSHEAAPGGIRDVPSFDNPKYWTDEVLNEQYSYFNQIVGMVIATELAHHYLGQYKKYAAKYENETSNSFPFDSCLTPAEWDESMKAGAHNALACGFGVDGIIMLYEAINKLPGRPAWTAHFLPATVKVDKLKKDLEKIEKRFFAGQE